MPLDYEHSYVYQKAHVWYTFFTVSMFYKLLCYSHRLKFNTKLEILVFSITVANTAADVSLIPKSVWEWGLYFYLHCPCSQNRTRTLKLCRWCIFTFQESLGTRLLYIQMHDMQNIPNTTSQADSARTLYILIYYARWKCEILFLPLPLYIQDMHAGPHVPQESKEALI